MTIDGGEQRPKAPAGWYPHPRMVDTRRYWDGERWTDHIAPASPSAPVPLGQPSPDEVARAKARYDAEHGAMAPPAVQRSGMLRVLLATIPVVGLILGPLMMRSSRRWGTAVLVVGILSTLYTLFWLGSVIATRS